MESEKLKNISVEQMREAAAAWKAINPVPRSIHDNVGDLIDEIERLRAAQPSS